MSCEISNTWPCWSQLFVPSPQDRSRILYVILALRDAVFCDSYIGQHIPEVSDNVNLASPRYENAQSPDDDIGMGTVTDAHLMRLEDEIRDALKDRRTIYEVEKDLLKKLIK